ncbi:pyruvate dehydrogenase complex dihydrolipoyllysine-residue acetyltransferase [Pseudomaricurvus alkylphenolicus]|jgi:pyruvate dehydrogenase E2 component (dihydrolipoamide acetyltransferase)|uniref:pyruvate dehydrogenase complex dihydrolipoyllysine-residue acetyltransferase n=1 Tax=Pseudomaricurvus alkylphenolicus TaxID=1306991 RepID=UPI0014218877|nr:pyruvate dehydrogenase complex dihydrolipoyllysine-residue acetyltransferase [Pseudomaricurvus alkylphenolicus]NIB42027.1 pyruvate dehydrogenase complex dihydrolipoyllysine-residue acetyltransferase [Pseudomaricurvus alkylphenolicus]
MTIEIIPVPDLGGADKVDVIEICVEPGEVIEAEQSLVVVESDKASMEVPSPSSGKVVALKVKEGDALSEGDAILELEIVGATAKVAEAAAEPAPTPDQAVVEAPAPAAVAAATGPVEVPVPDLGGADSVDVIELCVAVGDEVAEGDSLVVVESDKASMEIPSPAAGKVLEMKVADGDKVSEGSILLVLEGQQSAATAAAAAEPEAAAPEAAPAAPAPVEPAPAVAGPLEVPVPDLGGSDSVDVIEICVAAGDVIAEGDSLVVVESDKASMEIPSPAAGKVLELKVADGAKVSEGDILLVLEAEQSAAPTAVEAPAAPAAAPAPVSSGPKISAPAPVAAEPAQAPSSGGVYAGPSVRKLARQLGVDMAKLSASGPRGRLTKDDVRSYVKQIIADVDSGKLSTGAGIPEVPEIDFSQFGEIELQKMSKIAKVTSANMTRNWLNVPHVTQFDDADITELEAFRKSMKAEAEKRGVRLTPLPFLLKAAAAALAEEPSFNVSLHADGQHIVQKKYIHIGVAVDTPNGLMVPVIRDVDKKGLWELAAESVEVAAKARNGKLMPRDMQGGCFTISSLGAIGGNGFTPIVNAPEVAIMGVSKAQIKPVWNGSEFEPRQMLPLSVSYDHRAINGADCGRFFTYMVSMLGDIRKLLL